jgi:crotonobetainyl-CoA:carnitine CoA-transferase CaiB-like acyl-CoA transferase
MAGPLQGIRVLDLSAVISGPFCCQILADQGAEVIKVEPHGIGDLTRIGAYRVGTISAMYSTSNRGKHSVALDLSHPDGVAALKRLAADADVVVQNFRPGAVERMGISAADLHAVNPRLIYVSISGFGPDGPYSNWRVYDPIVQCVTGVVSTQMSQEYPVPDLVRTLICDKATATTAAQAITAALFARERGQASGQHLVIPMLDAALYWLWPDTFNGHTVLDDKAIPGPLLYQVYRIQPTLDGRMVYFAASDAEFGGLARALGHPEWMQDPRFDTPQKRQTTGNFQALGELLDDAFRAVTTADLITRLRAEQVPCAQVNDLDTVFTDPQVVNNNVVHTWEHPTVGTMRHARPPVRFSHTSHEPVWAVDELGQSTETVLRNHGYDDHAIAALRMAGVVR